MGGISSWLHRVCAGHGGGVTEYRHAPDQLSPLPKFTSLRGFEIPPLKRERRSARVCMSGRRDLACPTSDCPVHRDRFSTL